MKYIDNRVELISIQSWTGWKGFSGRKIFQHWMNKPDPDFLFHWQVARVIAKLKAPPDVIYSRSMPFSSAVLGLKLKARLKKPWLMHISDPWSDTTFLDNRNTYNLEAEKECFLRADMVSFTTPETLEFYKRKYTGLAGKFIVCPNVFDESDLVQRSVFFENKKLTCLYSGNLYGKRTLRPLVEAVKLLDQPVKENLEILIAGFLSRENEEMLKEPGLFCIKYMGPLPAAKSYQLQQKVDILVSVDKPPEQETDIIVLPSKIQDYIAARKLILGITGKGSATYRAVHSRYGFCFEHGEIVSIAVFLANAVQAFQAKNQSFFSFASPDEKYEAGYNASLLLKYLQGLIHE